MLREKTPTLRLVKGGRIDPVLFRKVRQVLNWGTTEARLEAIQNVLNKPSAVGRAVNKITAFQTLKEAGVNVPQFWTQKEKVARKKGAIVFARTKVTGSSGAGIVPVREGDALPEAPLYVSYVRKDSEYRVHVFKEKPIFFQQKLAKAGVDRTPDQALIRSHGNGYVFAENNVNFLSEEVKQDVTNQAIRAVAALGLDFGAVDLVVGKTDKKAYVLEVNTAPGLESTALMESYSKAISNV